MVTGVVTRGRSDAFVTVDTFSQVKMSLNLAHRLLCIYVNSESFPEKTTKVLGEAQNKVAVHIILFLGPAYALCANIVCYV